MESNEKAKVSTKSEYSKVKVVTGGETTFVINVTTHTLEVKSTIKIIWLVPAPMQVDQSWQGLDSTASILHNQDVFEEGTDE